jgi:thiamine biosynthesis lipoprotein
VAIQRLSNSAPALALRQAGLLEYQLVMQMKGRTVRHITAVVAAILLVSALAGCQRTSSRYSKYSDSLFDVFNTLITVVAYTQSEEEFNSHFAKIRARFEQLHRLYDIYNDYQGTNSVKTINDNAGVQPVKVDKAITDLLLFSKDWYRRTGGKTNVAMGAVLRIWHDYREEGQNDPGSAKLPPMKDLLEAEKHTDIDKVIIDAENGTVYLADPEMSLDVGAVAKGYATEIVAREMAEAGLKSALISSGGNIRAMGKPLDGVRERWGVGIQNPDESIVPDEQNVLDVIFINDSSVASSGDYMRYYVVNGRVLHHIIDPATLMPADYYRAVTVMTGHAGVADFLSTTLFLLPYEQSRALAESLDGVEAVWVMPDGEVEATDGMKAIMRSQGASGASVR